MSALIIRFLVCTVICLQSLFGAEKSLVVDQAQQSVAIDSTVFAKITELHERLVVFSITSEKELKAYCAQLAIVLEELRRAIASYVPKIKTHDRAATVQKRVEEITKKREVLDSQITDLTKIIEDCSRYHEALRKLKIARMKSQKLVDELYEEKEYLENLRCQADYQERRLKELNDTEIPDAEKKRDDAQAQLNQQEELEKAQSERDSLEKELTLLEKSEFVKNSDEYKQIRQNAWDEVKQVIDSLSDIFEKMIDNEMAHDIQECQNLYNEYVYYRSMTSDTQLWPVL